MAQTQRISKNNTTITKTDNFTIVTLHQTQIVVIDRSSNSVIFNNGGWVTATTATRMNQVCNELRLPFSIGRKQGIMSCRDRRNETEHEFTGNTLTMYL